MTAGGRTTRARWRLLAAGALAVLIVGGVGWTWWSSLLPSSYSVMDMGTPDYGGGPHHAPGMPGMAGMSGGASGAGVSVAALTAPANRKADVVYDLVARKGRVRLASGETIDGYSFNNSTPGPTITVTVGQLLEVHVRNASVPEGITVHWHGVELPNAEDGVAGVTQDAIAPGHSFTYRFVASHTGTFWYHSHQVSHEEVRGGLFGVLRVLPRHPDRSVTDVVAAVHTYGGTPTVNGRTGDQHLDAAPGSRVVVHAVNTDDLPLSIWAGMPWTLRAIDGYDVHGPTPVSGKAHDLPAGGRAALEVTVPTDGSAARVQLGGDCALVIGPPGSTAPAVDLPDAELDLLHYGTTADVPFDPTQADRRFTYSIGRKFGFVDGRLGMQWSVNGKLFPDQPMFMVAEGDVVRIHLENHSGQPHPMHIHGHHVLVVARDGKPATGSPWWTDSLEVPDGHSFDIAFLADNPGIWMDHCHNLQHAAQGLVTHLMYLGVREPYRIGGASRNEPE